MNTIIKNSIEYRLKDLPLKFWEEHKGIPDYILAEKIGVSVYLLRKVRKNLNMRDRIAILENRFDKNREKGSFLQLRTMLEDPLISLTDVGEYFNFTKAQASIYFQSIYQRKYQGCFPGRYYRKVPFYKGQIYQVYLDALTILKKKKFKKAKIVRKDYTFRIHVNGYVLSAHRLYRSTIKKYPYMHTVQTTATAQRDDVDFFFCFTQKRMYLIPKEYLTARSISVHTKHTQGKYERFLDNWGVLKYGR